MDDKDRCWSFNKNGERCELIAGHDDNHAIATAWTDSEAWTPSTRNTASPAPAFTTEIETTEIPKATDREQRCTACNHLHTSGPCKCGCFTHI